MMDRDKVRALYPNATEEEIDRKIAIAEATTGSFHSDNLPERSFEVVFTESEWDYIAEILTNKRLSLESLSKRTKNSGYGKASTLDKAMKHKTKADWIKTLTDKIIERAI